MRPKGHKPRKLHEGVCSFLLFVPSGYTIKLASCLIQLQKVNEMRQYMTSYLPSEELFNTASQCYSLVLIIPAEMSIVNVLLFECFR